MEEGGGKRRGEKYGKRKYEIAVGAQQKKNKQTSHAFNGCGGQLETESVITILSKERFGNSNK